MLTYEVTPVEKYSVGLAAVALAFMALQPPISNSSRHLPNMSLLTASENLNSSQSSFEDYHPRHLGLRDWLETIQVTSTAGYTSAKSRYIGQVLAARHGWVDGQWLCLDRLWRHESRWQVLAHNESSGAYGIPQALPGKKMLTAGADWRNNPITQIEWGINYVNNNYGTPCKALSHDRNYNFY